MTNVYFRISIYIYGVIININTHEKTISIGKSEWWNKEDEEWMCASAYMHNITHNSQLTTTTYVGMLSLKFLILLLLVLLWLCFLFGVLNGLAKRLQNTLFKVSYFPCHRRLLLSFMTLFIWFLRSSSSF